MWKYVVYQHLTQSNIYVILTGLAKLEICMYANMFKNTILPQIITVLCSLKKGFVPLVINMEYWHFLSQILNFGDLCAKTVGHNVKYLYANLIILLSATKVSFSTCLSEGRFYEFWNPHFCEKISILYSIKNHINCLILSNFFVKLSSSIILKILSANFIENFLSDKDRPGLFLTQGRK